MTAKQAIKARCRDCLAGGRECTFTNCALKGLAQCKAGASRIKAIRDYCRWCMNGNPVNQCASPDCAIYQFRQETGGDLKIRFLPVKPHAIHVLSPSNSKTVEIHAGGNQ